ncbi:solute carrier family 23 member 1-like isoform X4 [Ciconia boyciana]|uniref:solute carrier family 23 member 1-like isoform X4 n=1 Tax=Ciconia boyciana TaxID=52775 RepID=UPI003B9E3D6E
MTLSSDKELNGLDNPSFVGEDGSHYCSSLDHAACGPEEGGGMGHSGSKLAYSVTDVPPWYLCILLGIQHFLTAMGGLVAIPLILSKELCLQHDLLTQSHLISTIFFVSGICTLLQVLFGVRLPIIQGGTFAFLTPTLAMLSLPMWKCPAWTQNATLVNASSPEFIEVWQTRMREDYFFHSSVLSVPERCPCAAAVLPERQEVPSLPGLPLPDLPGAAGALPELAAVLCADSDRRPPCGPHCLRPPGPDGHPWGCFVPGSLVSAALPRPVGSANRQPGWDIWHLSWSDFLHAGVRGRLLCLRPPVWGPAAAEARHQPRHRGGRHRQPTGWGLGDGEWHHIVQRERGGPGHHQGRESNGDHCWCLCHAPERHLWESRGDACQHTHPCDRRHVPCDVRSYHSSGDFQFAGIIQLDQVIQVLLTTGMFVGGLLGFILDNTIPGTQEERGLLAWKNSHKGEVENSQLVSKVYDLPFGIGTKYCTVSWFWYLPTCPKRLPGGNRMDELKAAGQESSVKASSEKDSEIGADTRI